MIRTEGQGFQQCRERHKRSAMKRKKQHDKETKEQRKQWKDNGCGHMKIKKFGFLRESRS